MFTRFNNTVYYVTLAFDPWPWKSIGVFLLSKVVCTKFDGPSLNGSVCITFTRFYNNVECVTLTFDPRPWKSIGVVLLS